MNSNHSVILVQRGISSQTHAVSGKSLKPYGNAVQSAAHGGVVFMMSAADYASHAYDIIGNTLAGQQWVPIFVAETAANTAKCCSPTCESGPGRTAGVATYASPYGVFCNQHAPTDAKPLYADAPPRVAPAPRRAEVQDVQPRMVERGAGAQIQEQSPESKPEIMAPPLVGSEQENQEPKRLPGGVVRPEPLPHLSGKPATASAVHFEAPVAPIASNDAPKPTPKSVDEIIAEKVEAAITPVVDAMSALADQLQKMQKPAIAQKRRAPKELTEFQLLQKKAAGLGINTFQLSKAKLEAAIDAKSNGAVNVGKDEVLTEPPPAPSTPG